MTPIIVNYLPSFSQGFQLGVYSSKKCINMQMYFKKPAQHTCESSKLFSTSQNEF